MTLRQKRVLAMLALANAMVVAGLIFSLVDSGRLGASPSFFSPHGGGGTPHQPCEWEATQRLAQAGLGGTVTLIPNGPLRFEIMYPPDPQEAYKEIPSVSTPVVSTRGTSTSIFARNDREAGLAAQSVWTAFDIATEVYAGEYTRFEYAGEYTRWQEEGCPTFTRVEVTILVHSTQIHASVRTPDLVALSTGELSEIEFIERVTYHFQR